MRKYFSEFLGTLFLVFVIVATGDPLAIGAALALIAMVLGPISGGHVNPAVTLALFSNNQVVKSDVMPYVLAQVVGGIAALQLHKAVLN